MKKLIVAFVMLVAINANSQWVLQNTGTNSTIQDVRFINSNTGWICGQNLIMKTTNGGENWITINTPLSVWFLKIFPVNQNIVYCVGYFNTILKSTNGGIDWILISSNGFNQYTACYFINEETGWIGGHDFRVLKTTNGGNSFDTTGSLAGIIKDIYFKNSLDGVLCGEFGNVKRTSNGGNNWYQSNIELPEMYNFSKLSFIDTYSGWLFNDDRRVYKTTNFGENWNMISEIPDLPNVIINSGIFTSNNTGYAAGSGSTIFKTTNGGQVWFTQESPPYGALSIYFINDSVGWRSGTLGRIFHTINGGNTVGIQNIGTEIPSKYSLSQNYPNPFNSMCNVQFSMSNAGNAKLVVYDVMGREVQTLVNELLKPRTYEVSFDGSMLNSGIYFYKLTTNGFTETKKMLLIK